MSTLPTEEAPPKKKPRKERKGPLPVRKKVYNSVESTCKKACKLVHGLPKSRGLLVLQAQTSRKWHVCYLGHPWRWVPRHTAVQSVEQVNDLLDSSTLGEVVDRLDGRMTGALRLHAHAHMQAYMQATRGTLFFTTQLSSLLLPE